MKIDKPKYTGSLVSINLRKLAIFFVVRGTFSILPHFISHASIVSTFVSYFTFEKKKQKKINK